MLEIAVAFSALRFHETYDFLDPDVRWVLVGGQTISGRTDVIAACEKAQLMEDDSLVRQHRALTITDGPAGTAVAVETVVSYGAQAAEITTVSTCDIYEFAEPGDVPETRLLEIRSYSIEVDTEG